MLKYSFKSIIQKEIKASFFFFLKHRCEIITTVIKRKKANNYIEQIIKCCNLISCSGSRRLVLLSLDLLTNQCLC